MRVLLFPFFVLAVVGLFLSVLAHACALMGWAQPLGPAVMSLHVGVFVVWFPAVLVANTLVANHPRKDFWKVALRGCPVWMRWTAYTMFAYALINFAIFMSHDSRQVSKKHEAADSPGVVRGFSGHWMAFYSAAAAILYSGMARAGDDPARRCPKGHLAMPEAAFCATCGAELEKSA